MKIDLEKNLKQFKDNIQAWSKAGDKSFKKHDQGMTRAYYTDAGQMNLVHFYAQTGQYDVAYVIAYWLDTVVRDQIPTELYTFLSLHDNIAKRQLT